MSLFSQPINKTTLDKILKISDNIGVPRSIAIALQIEESGDRFSGTLGDPSAASRSVGGYRSVGLYQLYEKPENLNYLLENFWYPYEGKVKFDITNPIHNAKVALRYLYALHNQFETWERALWFYNYGRVKNVPQETLDYATRIIKASRTSY